MERNGMMRVAVIGWAALATACQAVHSSELKDTKAKDLVLAGYIEEFLDADSVDVQAQMKTLQSGVALQFTQGETLTAAADLTAGISPSVSLAYNDLIELDRYYEGVVSKTQANGSYYLTYKDSADVTTTVGFATRWVAPITAPVANATVSGNNVVITWDPSLMPSSGRVDLVIDPANGYSYFRDIPNTGSYTADLSWMSGSGTIRLSHVESYPNLPGFAKTEIDMRNTARVAVHFSKTTTYPGAGKSLSSAEQLEDVLHECLHYCAPNEESYCEVDGERQSCCLE